MMQNALAQTSGPVVVGIGSVVVTCTVVVGAGAVQAATNKVSAAAPAYRRSGLGRQLFLIQDHIMAFP